jgi:hypothetical protein
MPASTVRVSQHLLDILHPLNLVIGTQWLGNWFCLFYRLNRYLFSLAHWMELVSVSGVQQ